MSGPSPPVASTPWQTAQLFTKMSWPLVAFPAGGVPPVRWLRLTAGEPCDRCSCPAPDIGLKPIIRAPRTIARAGTRVDRIFHISALTQAPTRHSYTFSQGPDLSFVPVRNATL